MKRDRRLSYRPVHTNLLAHKGTSMHGQKCYYDDSYSKFPISSHPTEIRSDSSRLGPACAGAGCMSENLDLSIDHLDPITNLVQDTGILWLV